MEIKLNPEKDFVVEMRRKIKENNGYCPCSVIKNEDTKCICKDFFRMEEGTCHCGLYIKTKD